MSYACYLISVLLKIGLVMVFIATFNTISVISWRSVLLVEETGVPGENHRTATRQWQTLSRNASSTPLSKRNSSKRPLLKRDRRGRYHMVVGFTTTYALCA
jgi:hypothetical protein